jgi:two-component system chemotaxis response regulator CheB
MATAPAHPSRVVVADDSAFMRRLLTDGLTARGFEVAGVARNGDEALVLCRKLNPDALTLDLAMPGIDGIGVLRALRDERSPIPVVVVSAFSPAHGARAVDALSEGALELVAKPAAADGLEPFLAELAEKVRTAAGSCFRVRRAAAPAARPAVAAPVRARTKKTVVIACSTGGPKALAELLPRLPSPLGNGGLIVQHMPAGFTASLAQRLDRASALTVREAENGATIDPGTLLLAPGGTHLRLSERGVAELSDEPAIGGLRPRADLTIADAAQLYKQSVLLVVLTGMGKDGLDGARVVRRFGGRVLAEAESTCAIYGMPRAVVEADLADGVYPLHELPAAIAAEAGV